MDPLLRSLKQEDRDLQDKACPLCQGMGMRVIEDEGSPRYAVKCECMYALAGFRALERARIPRQYEECTFESFTIDHAPNSPLSSALTRMRKFVDGWEKEEIKKGLLITGAVGVGKTHLAVATLRALVSSYGAKGLFYDHRSLLKAVQNTYNSRSLESELDVLEPVFKADVLVLDELGRENRTEWAGEMIEHILNTRYNERLTTIITTNYPNRPPQPFKSVNTPKGAAEQATREVTLGDRVGQQVFSRLQEMCYVVPMSDGSWAEDFRQSTKRPTVNGGKYRALQRVTDGIRFYRPGEILELTEEHAYPLLANGMIEALSLSSILSNVHRS